MRRFLSAALVVLMILSAGVIEFPRAWAATTNVSPATSNHHILTFTIGKQYTATTAGVVRFNMPYPARLLTVQATARASGGTAPTLTVDVLEAAVSVLSAPISITAGTVSEGTITDADIADEATITVDLTIGGTAPTWDDIVVVMVIARK